MRKKVLLIAVFALACTFALITVASAETFYVGTVDELKAANQSAVDNDEADTIYITADINNAPFVATTSVTYILQANWTNCHTDGGAAKYADYVDIAFYADGAERTLTFTGNVLMTNQSVKPNNSSITYGGVNGGRLKVDLSSYKNLFMLSTRNYTINLYDVTFTGLRMDKNDWTMLSGKVINIYEGAKIENCSNTNAPIIDAGTLNIYGGEITNCYTKNNMGRFIYATNFNMFGGSIHGNYQYNYRTDNYTNYFIDITGSANIYGGRIYGNYYTQSGANSGMLGQSGMVSIKGSIVSSLIETNYSVSLPINVESVDGRFTLAEGTVAEVTTSCYRLSQASYSVMFKNSNGSVVEAFLVKDDGTLVRSFTGAAELAVPSGKWTATNNWCVESLVDLTKQGIYYATVAHKADDDDFDCTTTLTCSACNTVVYEAMGEHNMEITIVYDNYFYSGTYKCDCTNEGCTVIDAVESRDALFDSKGISSKAFGDGIGLVQGYGLNKDAILAYKAVHTDFDFGVLACANTTGGEIAPKPGDDKVIDITFDNMVNDYIDVKIVGIPENYADTPIVFCIYVTDNGEFYYLNDGETTKAVMGNAYNEFK